MPKSSLVTELIEVEVNTALRVPQGPLQSKLSSMDLETELCRNLENKFIEVC